MNPPRRQPLLNTAGLSARRWSGVYPLVSTAWISPSYKQIIWYAKSVKTKTSLYNTKEPKWIVCRLGNKKRKWKLNTNQSIRQWWQREEWFGHLYLFDGTHTVSLRRISDGGKGKRPFYHEEQPRREAFPLPCCEGPGVLHAFQQCTCTCQHFQSMLLDGVAYSLDGLVSIERLVFAISSRSVYQSIQLACEL